MTTPIKEIDWSQLSEGMLLSRAEFERLGECRGLERLEGKLYLPPAAVRHRDHGKPHSLLAYWAESYVASTPGIEVTLASTVRMDLDNDPEPDLSLFRLAEAGGRVIVDEAGYLVGVPELAIEVSASTLHKDLAIKHELYRSQGVDEYLIWDTIAETVQWLQLVDEQYVQQVPTAAQIYKSSVFPGLWLNFSAIQAADRKGLLATLNAGLASPEHAAFVQQLANAKRSP